MNRFDAVERGQEQEPHSHVTLVLNGYTIWVYPAGDPMVLFRVLEEASEGRVTSMMILCQHEWEGVELELIAFGADVVYPE